MIGVEACGGARDLRGRARDLRGRARGAAKGAAREIKRLY